MTDVKKRYIHKFCKNLTYSKQTRLSLSNGLKDELSLYSNLSYEELCEQIGSPEQIALQMMENINKTEIEKAKRIRFIPFLLIGCVLVMLIVFLGTSYVHTKSVIRGDFYVKEKTTIESETVLDETFEEALRK